MRSQILEIYFMEIEYKRELTKSYMCVKTDQDFLPFEKEILTRSSILGIVPVNTIFADAATAVSYTHLDVYKRQGNIFSRKLTSPER